MTWLGARLPAQQGVAAYSALRRAADTARAAGDERGRGQVMADRLVERLTGQATADAVPREIHLVMTGQTQPRPRRQHAHRTPLRQRTSTARRQHRRKRVTTAPEKR
jgi:hypothetical protein